MYENIKKAIANHENETIKKFNNEIENKTAGELLASWYYRDRMTETVKDALSKCDPDSKPDAAIIAKMQAKNARREQKQTARRLEKVAAAESARAVELFDVSVEWTRSRMWGYNPHATVRAWATVTRDSASGCGYDKESAAIAGAMNENPEIMRILYDHAEKGEPFPYSVRTFAGLPSFDGGCGVSCFRSVFEACGFEWRDVASGEIYNAYTATRKATNND